MVIKNETNRKLLFVYGAVTWILAVIAALWVSVTAGPAAYEVVDTVALAGLFSFVAAIVTSWLFYKWPAVEAVLLAFALVSAVDVAAAIASTFVEYHGTLPLDNTGMVFAIALAVAAIGGMILGVALIRRPANNDVVNE